MLKREELLEFKIFWGVCLWRSKLASSCSEVWLRPCFKADYPPISLVSNRLMDVTQLALTWVGWPNGFDLDQSERKTSQVSASARKPWPNGVARRRKLKTWVYLRLRLARALCAKYNKVVLSCLFVFFFFYFRNVRVNSKTEKQQVFHWCGAREIKGSK